MLKLVPALIVILFALGNATLADAKPCPAATLKNLATVWVGSTLEAYYALELSPDGTGVVAVHWGSGKPAKAYRISTTKMKGRRVDFDLQSLDAPAEILYMRGETCPGSIDLQLGSVAPKWRLDVMLQPYESESERLMAVMDRIQVFRKSQ